MNNIELINASAGSGKTYKLTSLVVDILKTGVAPETLMATTFTIKAAAEIRERIRVKLLENQKFEEAARINDGFIGTVNGICARLLKEYALDAGVSPAIDVMPENDGSRIFKIAIDSVINQYADRMEPAAQRLELDGRVNGYQSTADWREQVNAIVDLARSNQILPNQLQACSRSSWESLQTVFGEPLTTNIDHELQGAMALAINHLDNIGQLTKTTQSAFDTLKDCDKRLKNNRLPWSDWVRLAKLKAAKDGQDIVSPVKSVADNVLKHPLFQADVKQIIEGTFDCAILAIEGYATYKREHGLMDFSDQETRVLDMAQHNEAFRSSMRDRIQTLMVDEFQDTSPIQLALFLVLNELAGYSVWVGDPKQAIYGFRGTDPQLMDEVVALISESHVLDYSWRSRENLIDFTNALFAEVFHDMNKEKVCLKIPTERAEKAKDGWLEAWHLKAKNNEDEATIVANGIRDLIKRIPGIKPGDIAVLCRTNANCTAIADSLEHLGIRVSVGQGLLMDTRECQLAVAALQYMNNQGDTLALAEIIRMTPEHESHEDWLAELMANPLDTKKKWCSEPMIASLNEGRSHVKNWSPLEALEQAISRINLLRSIESWSNHSLAISNLDALRGTCREYMVQCDSRRSSATINGFVAYLQDSEFEQAQGMGEQTVNLLTYHGAKGLEWPWVVLTGLDATPRADVFGVRIEAAPIFDPSNPLVNRKIRYWPWPFGAQKKYPLLDEKIEDLPIKQQIEVKAEREAQRLMYVGMTRAKDGMVMAMRKTTTNSGESLKTNWLDALTGANNESVIKWNTDIGNQIIQVGMTQIPITVFEYGPESEVLSDLVTEEEEYLPGLPKMQKEYLASRISPSSLSESNTDLNDSSWEIIERFNARISIKGTPKMDLLGSAIHAYLATDYGCRTNDERMKLAQRIMKNWGVEMAVDSSEIVAAGQRLIVYMDQHYHGYRAFKEWPMSMRNEKGQLIQGWIDLLLETPDGYVIIDHKDYPGQDAEDRVKKYAPQLRVYKDAVEKATGKTVIDTLLHLPISGLILRLQ
jgi:ATP-dependent exoDNAse (exonuclease V) beta subunit (contains helicase and exonuclease domains)